MDTKTITCMAQLTESVFGTMPEAVQKWMTTQMYVEIESMSCG